MIPLWGILEFWSRALTPWERARSVGRHWRVSWLKGSHVLLIGGGALAALVVIGIVMHLYRYRRRLWTLFRQQEQTTGLNPNQKGLLEQMARTAHMNNPAALFTSAQAFDRAVAAIPKTNRPDEAAIRLLRDRLGLSLQLGIDVIASQAPGEPLEIVAVLANEQEVHGRLVSATPEQTIIRLDEPAKMAVGESWRLRYAAAGAMAQMSVRVAGYDGQQVTLAPTSRARVIEHRRSARLSDSRSARVGPLPLLREDPVEAGVHLDDATVADSSEAGLRLRVTAPAGQYQVDQRAMLLAQLREGCCLQAVGRVRRVEAVSDEEAMVFLELTDLDQQEKIQLLREVGQSRPTPPVAQPIPQEQEALA